MSMAYQHSMHAQQTARRLAAQNLRPQGSLLGLEVYVNPYAPVLGS
jgi:hypothetical protein